MIKLYSYFRSSSSFRVRIALNLKGLTYETYPVHLLQGGGEQFSPEFKALNQASKIPVLIHDNNTLAQSTAIIEYLDETFPDTPLFPKGLYQKALVRQLCEIINSDIQPLQNLSVLKKIKSEHGFSEDDKVKWIQHWISLGFQSFESLLNKTAGQYCFQDQPGAADCFLVPQVYNALRFNVDMSSFPKIKKIHELCLKHESFIKAHPDNQPDTPQEN